MVLQNHFCYGQSVQKSRKKSEKAGEYLGTGSRIDKREKRVETTGEGIKNGTTQEENYSIGLVPLITATEFVQNG